MNPLENKVFITTRPFDKRDFLPNDLRGKGAVVIEMPMIEILPLELTPDIEKCFYDIKKYNWLIFTSKNGVRCFFHLFKEITGNRKLPNTIKTAVVGKKTAGELYLYGYKADFTGTGNSSDALLSGLLKNKCIKEKEKVLLPLGYLAGDILEKGIAGIADVRRINVYRTAKPKSVDQRILKRIRNDDYDLILFTSPSGFNNFISFVGKESHLINLKAASIGKTTSSAIIKEGYKPLFTAKISNSNGLVREIEDFFNRIN